MAGYYIQGLLNTETAWDSYCIYGYKSNIDKRYFCAVQTSNIFYASIRDSAYINIYIYCKGQQVSTLKCISNTGSEYDVSAYHYSTSDPTVTRIYEHSVWSNMNGRQVTMADFLSNAPILNGVNLSDEERDALAINYLNNVPEPYGQGTVTLSIKKPGQTLNFASRLLSKTVSQYISSNATININTNSGLIVETISKHYERQSGQRFWNEQIATFEAPASEYVGIIFAQYTGSWPLDTRAYFGFCPSRRLYSSEGLHVSGGFTCISANDTPSSMIDSAWIQDYYAAVNMNMTYTIARFKGISDFYLNRTISSSIGNALNTYFTETLDAGIYISVASLTVQGDTEVTVLNVTDENDNIIDKSSTYDNYGYMNACDTTILNVASSTEYKIKAQCSASRSISLRWTLIKVNAGTYYEKTFSATFGTSLSQVGSITLPAGDYILTSYAAYDVNNSKYYQEIRRANNDVIISDSHYSSASYAMAINVACMVSLDSQETIKLYAKIDSSDISISCVIRAVCIKER